MKKLAVVLLLALVCIGSPALAPAQDKDKEKIDMLIGELRQGNPRAAYVLGEMGPKAKEAIPALVEALKRQPMPGESVADNAALALGKIGPDAREAVPALTQTLADREWTVRRHAAIALGEIGPDAQPALAALDKLTRDPDPLVQKAAKEARGKIRPPPRR